ncbi:MAG: hypothetical protein QY310_12605 [Candidatus Jettenia sp. CY-1]|nr:hypothetical protein [Candidatus Jettenia sp.]WKZ18262.1 MAG: hypothetical protein QY310_12605 [Candidatus Jettenia sp. CY-1]
MVIHEDITVQDDSISFQPIMQQLKKHILVMVVFEYRIPFVTPACDMV